LYLYSCASLQEDDLLLGPIIHELSICSMMLLASNTNVPFTYRHHSAY